MAATAGEDCVTRLWDLATGALLGALHGHQGRSVWCLTTMDGMLVGHHHGSALCLCRNVALVMFTSDGHSSSCTSGRGT